MKTRLLLPLLLLSAVAAACGDAKNDGSNTTDKAAIDGQTPVAYYSQFVSKKKSTNPADIKLLVANSTVLQNTTTVTVTGELLLNDDGTFDFTYKEPGIADQGISGRWRLQDKQLIIGDLGVARGMSISGRKGLTLKMGRDLHLPGLKGQEFKFTI